MSAVPKKSGKRTSKIWNYFTRLDSAHARCEMCRKRVSYKSSISNLKRHKIRKHSNVTSNVKQEYPLEFTIPLSPVPSPQILYVETEGKPSPSDTKQNRNKRSKLWNYFTRIDSNMATCKACEQTVSYKTSTSNLKRHKIRKHPTLSWSDDDEAGFSESAPGHENGMDVVHDAEDHTKPSTSSNNTPTTSRTAQLRQERPTSIKKAKQRIDECLIQLFTVDFQKFSLVDDIGFRGLVKMLNASYELPSRKTIVKTYIPNLYERCLLNMKQFITNIKAACLTIDCWTSITNDNYMSVTAHFINDDYKLNTMLLECAQYSETSENLAAELQAIIERWDLNDKIIICVSDHSSAMKEAVASLGSTHLGCFAHSLNSVVENALLVCESLLKKIRTIAGHFRRNSYAKSQLDEFYTDLGAAQRKINTDVSTRWNSTLYMLESFIELDTAIQATIPLLEDTELPVLERVEWKSIKQLCKMLKPFEEATQQVSGNKYMPASLVIPITIGLHRVCRKMKESSDLQETPSEVHETLQTGLNQVFENIEYCTSLAMCTFLDPRFKHIGFQDPLAVESIKKELTDLLTEIISKNQADTFGDKNDTTENTDNTTEANDEFSIWNSYDLTVSAHKPSQTAHARAVIEVQRYVEDELLDRKADPLVWWREHSYNYPYLKQVVLEQCCTLATSVPCERLSSKEGNLFLEWRTRLKGDKVNQMLTLNVNRQYL